MSGYILHPEAYTDIDGLWEFIAKEVRIAGRRFRNFLASRAVYQIRETPRVENTNFICGSCIMCLLRSTLRGFTNFLIRIPAKTRTISGRVEGRRSVRSLTHISRFLQGAAKALCGRKRPSVADTDLVSIAKGGRRADDGWRLYQTGGHGYPFQRAR